MKNTVQARLAFDFRGEQFSACITIDLDAIMLKQGDLNGLYDMLADSIGLDAYRHEYDVMLMEDISFSEPTGLACKFVHDGQLNFDGFIETWEKQRILDVIQPIAERHLNISDLSNHRELETVLIECYRAGQKKQLLINSPQSYFF